MKFSAVTLACLATGVYSRLAEPPTRVLERDLATVTGVINTAGQDIDSLDKAVKGFSGDSKPVEDAASQLISDLGSGKSKVDASDKLTLQDALGLTTPVQDLQKKGQTLADDLHSQKSAIEKAGLCDTTRKLVTDINTASKALISSVVSKVPEAAQDIAKQLADGLTQVLNKAQDDFSESNCKNSGGSGSSTGGASAPASTGGSGSPTGGASAPVSTGGSGSKTTAAGTGSVRPTGGATTPSQPTGTGAPTKATTAGPVITAGAALIAPAGALAVAVAALMV